MFPADLLTQDHKYNFYKNGKFLLGTQLLTEYTKCTKFLAA